MAIFFATLSRFADRSGEADRYEKWLRSLPPECLPTVDVFLPTYNEGKEFVERGIVAAKALDYPRFRVWVLDDGKRDWLRELCAAKGVEYIRRPDNLHAKAGNINNALALTNGELFVVFDADFTPRRNFLFRTVGFFFADPRVTIVQTPQHFYNPDIFQVNLKLANVIQDNEREWFDVILGCRDAWNCAFCCGTSRRLSTRRHPEHRRGRHRNGNGRHSHHGENASTRLSDPLPQRESEHGTCSRKHRESVDPAAAMGPRNDPVVVSHATRPGLEADASPVDIFPPFHYLLDFPCRLLFVLLPLVYLWTGLSHFSVNSTGELAAYLGPAILCTFLSLRWLVPQARIPLLTPAISFYLSARIFPTVITSLIRPFGVPFMVTPKGRGSRNEKGDPMAVWGLVILIILTVGGIIVGCRSPGQFHSHSGLLIATAWALCNLVLFGMTLLAISQRPRRRGEERFAINRPGELATQGRTRNCTVVNLSLTGALLGGVEDLEIGEIVRISIDDAGSLPGRVIRKTAESQYGVHFSELTEVEREKLILYLYTSGFCCHVQELKPMHVFWQMLTESILDPA